MPAYHSTFLDTKLPVTAGFATPPFESRLGLKTEGGDTIDEAILLFRPNAYFKTFEIRGPADRTLAYTLLYIGDCLARLKPSGQSLAEATKQLTQQGSSGFLIPGEAAFPLKSMFPEPASKQEAEQLREYLTKLRAETLGRLLAAVYAESKDTPSQWWMAFQKRKFMGKSLNA